MRGASNTSAQPCKGHTARLDQQIAFRPVCPSPNKALNYARSWSGVLKTSTPVPPAGFSLSARTPLLTASAIDVNSLMADASSASW
jgi:hypothetical protein